MVRTLACSLVGAGAGFLAGVLGISVVLGIVGGYHSDTFAVSVFVGAFLAGAGAIAGAVMGGVADLLGYFRRKDQALREAEVGGRKGE